MIPVYYYKVQVNPSTIKGNQFTCIFKLSNNKLSVPM